ncbi:TrmH family RNA methyltransferase [Streptococcus caprae]|uniref:TrmH family RNA methyltransferase n=1 Tax=Streptococcus caprae TaxID=1640501 RepID=A0ABV8CXZ7_9STRE
MTIITSKSNALIKATRKLLQKKYRTQSYLIEGWHLFEEATKSGASFRHVFVEESQVDKVANFPQVHLVTAEILKSLTDSRSPQGIVAEVEMAELSQADLSQGRYLVLEDVQDPGNLGTLVRTADAAGFDGVFISEKSADLYNLKTLRSMQGSHFHLPIYRTDVLDLVKSCRAAGLMTLATTLSQSSVDYRSLARYDSFALIMGNEGQGISQDMAEAAEQLVHITMPGQAESLNVAIAAGILMFHLL